MLAGVCTPLACISRMTTTWYAICEIGDTMNIEQFVLVTNGSARTGKETVSRNAGNFVQKHIKAADDIVVISGFNG